MRNRQRTHIIPLHLLLEILQRNIDKKPRARVSCYTPDDVWRFVEIPGGGEGEDLSAGGEEGEVCGEVVEALDCGGGGEGLYWGGRNG